LKALDVGANITAEYTLSSISTDGGETNPVLIVRVAGESNKGFANEQLKMTRKNANAYRAGAVNMSMVADTRSNDRRLYSKYVVVGWTNVVDADGASVAFSVSECNDFIESLPDWIFDELRNFCSNPSNFVDTVNVEGISKN